MGFVRSLHELSCGILSPHFSLDMLIKKCIFMRLYVRITTNQTVLDLHTYSPWSASQKSSYT
jgi:hypothetical protein